MAAWRHGRRTGAERGRDEVGLRTAWNWASFASGPTIRPSRRRALTSFAIYATVAKDKLADSQHLLEHRLHKLRDQVIVVTRLMPLADFNDPELKSFRRRILLQLRRTLPELAIENVYVSDFELTVERI